MSHTWRDKPLARRLASDLSGLGIRVWLDEAELLVGDSLIEKIRKGIDEMDYLAVILSPDAVASRWVQREVEIAMNHEIDGRRVKVLPILYRKCRLPGYLVGKLYADFSRTSNYGTALLQLLRRLGIADEDLAHRTRELLAPLSVGALLTGDVAFTRDICHGLRMTLAARQAPIGRLTEFCFVNGPNTTYTDHWNDWRSAVSLLMARATAEKFDYLVGIGTEACMALKRALGSRYGKDPFVFAGVTYPVETGLVSRLHRRSEEAEVCGVRYGGGVLQVARIVHKVLPDHPLVFIYQKGIPQDQLAARELRSSDLFRRKILKITETLDCPTVSDMPSADVVYFSWYTAEKMLETKSGLEVMKKRLFVTASKPHVASRDLAIMGVAADDLNVGQLAAEIILDHVRSGSPLGKRDVEIAPLQYWLNVATAARRGVRFSETAIKEAAQCFGSAAAI